MDKNTKIFVVYIALLISKITIYQAWKAQIALFIIKKVIILAKYTDFANLFLKKFAKVLSKSTGINEYFTKLVKSKKSPYRSIYSTGLVEFKIFKPYIDINLANGIIWPSKSFINSLIFFICKLNSKPCLDQVLRLK